MIDDYVSKDPRHELLFNVTMSRFYYSRRARFLNSFRQLAGIVTVFINASSVVTLLTSVNKILPVIAGAVTVVVTLIDRFCHVADEMYKAEDAARHLSRVLRDIETMQAFDEEEIKRLRKRAHAIESPTYVLNILHDLSYNDTVRAMGIGEEHLVPLKFGWLQLFMAPVFDLGRDRDRKKHRVTKS